MEIVAPTAIAPAFYGLLDNPPGQYGFTPYGNTHAVSLTGSPAFRERAFNLFASFGGGTSEADENESRLPTLHTSERLNTAWFCMPPERVLAALRLYLFGQLWQYKGQTVDILDEDGDRTDCTCLNEDALMAEATELATLFMATEMPRDWAAFPDNGAARVSTEHGVATGFGDGAGGE